MEKSKETGILKIKRKKFGDEVLVLYMYRGNVVYAYSPFYGETVKDIHQFLSGVVKSYKWDLIREFVELSDEEIISMLKVPGIRNDEEAVSITRKLRDILDEQKGIISYAVFDDKGFLISGYNFDPMHVPRFVRTSEDIVKRLRDVGMEHLEFILTRHDSDYISIFFPMKGGYLFFFLFDSKVLYIGYVISSLINEIKSELEAII